jgi:hypothetical protein
MLDTRTEPIGVRRLCAGVVFWLPMTFLPGALSFVDLRELGNKTFRELPACP